MAYGEVFPIAVAGKKGQQLENRFGQLVDPVQKQISGGRPVCLAAHTWIACFLHNSGGNLHMCRFTEFSLLFFQGRSGPHYSVTR